MRPEFDRRQDLTGGLFRQMHPVGCKVEAGAARKKAIIGP